MADEKPTGPKQARLKRKVASNAQKGANEAKKEAADKPADAAAGEPAVPSGRLSSSAVRPAPPTTPAPDAAPSSVATPTVSPGMYGAEGDPWVYEVRPDGSIFVRDTVSGKSGVYRPGSGGHTAIQKAIQGQPGAGSDVLTLGGGAAGRPAAPAPAAPAPAAPAPAAPAPSPAELPGESPVEGEPATTASAPDTSEQPVEDRMGQSEQPVEDRMGQSEQPGLTDDRIREAVQASVGLGTSAEQPAPAVTRMVWGQPETYPGAEEAPERGVALADLEDRVVRAVREGLASLAKAAEENRKTNISNAAVGRAKAARVAVERANG